MSEQLIEALRRALEAAPDDLALRVHLAELLLADGRSADAVSEAATALQYDPANVAAREVMSAALGGHPAPPTDLDDQQAGPSFDWHRAESEVAHLAPPMFTSSTPAAPSVLEPRGDTVTFEDVGGMDAVKDRLNTAFLAPLRNPELRAVYGKSLRGGLLMYGPPGCGKTYLARALAGELGAGFLSVGLSDVLDPFMGVSEANVHGLFEQARREGPTVVFLDEIDALGQRRSQMVGTAMRGVVNQLLTELDGVDADNAGVFVLAATNQPWDVDPAFRRPGRFDRTVLVLPPDEHARRAIFERALASRPVEGIDLDRLAGATEGFSGADIAHICESAAEKALLDSVRSGVVRLIGMDDLLAATGEVRPSIGEWLDVARNVVLFGTDDGTYTELRSYLKRRKRL